MEDEKDSECKGRQRLGWSPYTKGLTHNSLLVPRGQGGPRVLASFVATNVHGPCVHYMSLWSVSLKVKQSNIS